MNTRVSFPNTFLTRSTWKTGTIWFLLILLAIAPLFPFSNFVGHPHWNHIRWIPFQDFLLSRSMLKDVIGNTLWFVVFGYLLHSQLHPNSCSGWTMATITAVAGGVSLSAEFFQVFCHNRLPSMTDVLCNVLGASLGGYIAEKQPPTASIEPWLAKWLAPIVGHPRFTRTSRTCKQNLPLE